MLAIFDFFDDQGNVLIKLPGIDLVISNVHHERVIDDQRYSVKLLVQKS